MNQLIVSGRGASPNPGRGAGEGGTGPGAGGPRKAPGFRSPDASGLTDSEPAVLADDVQVDAPFARDLPDLKSDPAFEGTAFLSGVGEAGRNSGGGLPPRTKT